MKRDRTRKTAVADSSSRERVLPSRKQRNAHYAADERAPVIEDELEGEIPLMDGVEGRRGTGERGGEGRKSKN